MSRIAIAIPLLTTALLAQDPAADLWMQDFAAAKAKAKAEKKDLLVDFTGSDWCGWCIRLDEEVFSKEAFRTAAPKSFVLVKLDYPQNQDLVTPEIKKQNDALQVEYSIQGFPTILLMDDAGRVYAQAGYQEGGPEPYVTMLDEYRQRGADFRAALTAVGDKQGVERAEALDACLATLPDEVASTYHFAIMQEICRLDADGEAGLKAKYEAKVEEIELGRQANLAAKELNELIAADMRAGEGEKALEKLDKVLEAPKNTMHQQMAMFFKGMVTMDTSGDAKAAVAVLEAAQKLAPDSPVGQQIAAILPRIKQQIRDDGGK